MKRRAVFVAAVVTCALLSGGALRASEEGSWAPILLSGQSNARELSSHLAQLHPVMGAWQGGTAISAWAEGGALWQRLVPTSLPPVRAIVWWQGESDQLNAETAGLMATFEATYRAALTSVVTRLRAETGPDTLVVICGAVSQEPLRSIQSSWAADAPNAVFVPSSDLPNDGALHLVAAGYTQMAERIMAAIVAHESGSAGSSGATPISQSDTSTGTVNNFSLSASYTYLRVNNASPVTYTGFAVAGHAPSAGDVLILDNVGTSTVAVGYQTTSTAAYQIITPSLSGQIIGANGRMLFVYDGTTSRWRESLVEPGEWITPSFDPGDFTGGSMVWTVESGDVTARRYQQRGRQVDANIDIRTTSVAGTLSSQLRIALPRSWNVSPTAQGVGMMSDNGGTLAATWAFASGGMVGFFRDFTASANWSAATNTTRVTVAFSFPID